MGFPLRSILIIVSTETSYCVFGHVLRHFPQALTVGPTLVGIRVKIHIAPIRLWSLIGAYPPILHFIPILSIIPHHPPMEPNHSQSHRPRQRRPKKNKISASCTQPSNSLGTLPSLSPYRVTHCQNPPHVAVEGGKKKPKREKERKQRRGFKRAYMHTTILQQAAPNDIAVDYIIFVTIVSCCTAIGYAKPSPPLLFAVKE